MVIDQFLTAGEDKWGQQSGLVLMLPHGFEGQGPEHSSARIERFLQNCAEGNMRVVVPSTPGQYFHVLRRQVLQPARKPLILFTPKSLLRTRDSFSAVSELSTGEFRPVMTDPVLDSGADRLLLAAGKVVYDLERGRRDTGADRIAIVRLEQLYPFPAEELEKVLAAHPGAQVWWVQEEPENMGGWSFVAPNLAALTEEPPAVVARAPSASPATGSYSAHLEQQAHLVTRALEGAD